TVYQLSTLLNRVQRHNCTTAYCLRVKKGAPADSMPECHFYAPWQLQEEPSIDKNKNLLHWMFSPARNDERLNSYSRLVAMAWMANTKYRLTLKLYVLNYIAKYCTKEEKKTATYADLVKEVLPHLNCAKPLLSLVSKTINKLIRERDWSAQEVCHLLLNIPLQQA
ncbi:hypothetical protein F5882DRAFT_263196, partial [Hyaloscypha sp. PMI_1271]